DRRAGTVLARTARRAPRSCGRRDRDARGRAAGCGRRAPRVRLLLASRNPNKLRELRRALPDWEIELLEPESEPVEDGATFMENARIKASHGRAHAPVADWVAGEDSGIEVAALGGRPGVQSARWADDPVARLLSELAGVGERSARYVCELVVLSPRGEELCTTGTREGKIALEPRG